MQLRCDGLYAGIVEIRDGNVTCTLSSEATRKCATDAFRATGDSMTLPDFHVHYRWNAPGMSQPSASEDR
jgi:hypothetical protein